MGHFAFKIFSAHGIAIEIIWKTGKKIQVRGFQHPKFVNGNKVEKGLLQFNTM